jgi:hypothetical protein
VEAALNLGSIVVRNQSFSAEVLKSKGVEKNVQFTPRPESGARMLSGGHVNGWCAPQSSIRTIWRNEKFDESRLQVGESLALMPLWIAGSKNLPPEVIRKMTARYREMKADGSYDRIFAAFK